MSPVGTHILLEHYGGAPLTDAPAVEGILRAAAKVAGATVLSSHIHRFTGGGVTGVCLLAESHITIHTWPERGYAALDLFLCGAANVDAAIAHLEAAFAPTRSQVTRIPRG